MKNRKNITLKVVIVFISVFVVFALLLGLLRKPKNQSRVAAEMLNNQSLSVYDESKATTTETINTLSIENRRLQKHIAQLSDEINNVKSKTDGTVAAHAPDFSKVINQLKKATKNALNESNQKINELENTIQTYKHQLVVQKRGFKVGDDQIDTQETVWIKDMSHTENLMKTHSSAISNVDLLDQRQSLLNPGTSGNQSSLLKHTTHTAYSDDHSPSKTPYFTLPENAWLTNAIALQPLVGRIPIDGQVINPRSFEFMVERPNLAANGVHLPLAVKGALGRAVCEGDLLSRSVTCKVISLTFVFQDGRISTTHDDSGLGTVTDAYGNPMIRGTLHSNAGLYLGAKFLMKGVEGYGNALSAAQVQSVTGGSIPLSIGTLIKNAKTYAAGQALSGGVSAVDEWLNQRMQNSFDYVFVPNWNPQTHQLIRVNIQMTKQIDIDYDHHGRKVYYAYSTHNVASNTLD